jgi:hypothetical protein
VEGRRLECQVSGVGGSCLARVTRTRHFLTGEQDSPGCCRCPRREERRGREGSESGMEWSAVGWVPATECVVVVSSSSAVPVPVPRSKLRRETPRTARGPSKASAARLIYWYWPGGVETLRRIKIVRRVAMLPTTKLNLALSCAFATARLSTNTRLHMAVCENTRPRMTSMIPA